MAETNWQGAYTDAVVVADGNGALLKAILERTMDAIDWLVAAPQQVDKWEKWKATRPVN